MTTREIAKLSGASLRAVQWWIKVGIPGRNGRRVKAWMTTYAPILRFLR